MNKEEGKGIFRKQKRIIAIGDLHGDMMQLLSILKFSKLIEHIEKKECIDDSDLIIEKWRWIGGSCYVVQMGDIFDGGGRKEVDSFEDKEVEILIFLIRLKELAKKKGGDVLILFGNHEYMNFNGDYSYVQKKTMLKCLKEGINELDIKYEYMNKKCNDRERLFRRGEDGILSKIMKKYCYGIIKIGNTIFCHGGLKKELGMKYSINKMNILLDKYLLDKLEKEEKKDFEKVYGRDGIIWFRGYVNNIESSCKDLKLCLEEKKADRMVVGHTVQMKGISTKCRSNIDKTLWAIDVGLSRAFSAIKCEYLEIKNDNEVKKKNCKILLKECKNKFR